MGSDNTEVNSLHGTDGSNTVGTRNQDEQCKNESPKRLQEDGTDVASESVDVNRFGREQISDHKDLISPGLVKTISTVTL